MRRRAGVAGWAGLVGAALLGAGGAQASGSGWVLGLPTAAGFVVIGLGAGLLLVLRVPDVRPAAGLLPLLAIVLSGLPVPGVGALAGGPLAVPALAVFVLVLAGRLPAPPRRLFFPVVSLLFAAHALRVQATVGLEGDEPHYLMVAESILHAGDLSLEDDYAAKRSLAFRDGPLEPHYRVRGRGGAVYSLHALGLSLLVLPAYAAGGHVGAALFMALLAALLANELRRLAAEWTGDEAVGDGVGWLLALSAPLVHYAGLVFTEVPAALAVAWGLRLGRRPDVSPGQALACGAALAFLPWLNVRNAVLTVLLLAFVLAGRPRARTALAWTLPSLVSALSLVAYHWALYGFLDPRRVYGRRPEFSVATLAEGLPGLLLDQEFGLLVYAPVLALAPAGLWTLARRSRRESAVAVAILVAVLLTAGSWHMWRGGFNPPGRFLVPILPALAVGVAGAFARGGLGAGRALLAAWSLWAGLAGAWDPPLVHRDRDGTAPFFRAHSGAREWTALLPRYVLPEDAKGRGALTAVWALALVAGTRAGGPVTAARVAWATAGLLAATGAASILGSTATGGRDAVRLVGRPGLRLPGWTPVANAEGEWGASALGHRDVHQPQRRPEGLEIGSRLPLPPGRYALEVSAADEGASQTAPPHLVLRPEPVPVGRASGLVLGQGRDGASLLLSGAFRVRPGERAVTLVLRGGGPLALRTVRLSRIGT